MESQEDSCNSLPYIDDTPTDDETNSQPYNLKIIENYHNKNRNIEITNRTPHNALKPLGSVAPLADGIEFSDNRLSDSSKEEVSKDIKLPSKDSGMKLIIKGWNSSISIQGLDHKSSITFKRQCEKVQKKEGKSEERKKRPLEETKSVEKCRKGKWKMLTKSIMLAKSARFDRRGLDERYPKYVLLKNEEEDMRKTKENYPKMFLLNDKSSKLNRNAETKSEFSFKKSFKNKTEPIVPLVEIFAKTEESQSQQTRSKPKESVKKQKKPLTERNSKVKKDIVIQRRKSLICERKAELPAGTETNIGCSQIYNEIQGIFEDTLKLLPQEVQQSEEHQRRVEHYNSVPPQSCQFTCYDSYCSQQPQQPQPPQYVPVYASQKEYKSCNSGQNKKSKPVKNICDGEIELENLPFGILSSLFPRVVIMNTIRSDDLAGEDETDFKNRQIPKTEEVKAEEGGGDLRSIDNLKVPKQDLTLKSKLIPGVEQEMEGFLAGDVSPKEFPSLEDDQKNKSQGSEATEYLQYSEFDQPENESVERDNPTLPPRYESKEKESKSLPAVDKFKVEDVDENSGNLSLTKIGYKMYDNLTKLSLNREKELSKKPEASGCGCNGNGTKKSPYNITLESNNSVVKVTVPDNELNFQIINSEGRDIQIGVMSGREEEEEEKKVVRKKELWYSDDGGRAIALRTEKIPELDKISKSLRFFHKSGWHNSCAAHILPNCFELGKYSNRTDTTRKRRRQAFKAERKTFRQNPEKHEKPLKKKFKNKKQHFIFYRLCHQLFANSFLIQDEEFRKKEIYFSASKTFKVSLADNRKVVFSIEMNEKEEKEGKIKEKSTKEMKVGTDDFDLAGGDFVCALGGNYKNLSPRIGQLLKHLQEKLETEERERKFLDEKISQTLIDQKFQGGILPGVFLVKHVSPRAPSVKKIAEGSSFRKLKKDTGSHERAERLREYYCEECLATMRIFEDENPSVRSMVDKFETIIQLESY